MLEIKIYRILTGTAVSVSHRDYDHDSMSYEARTTAIGYLTGPEISHSETLSLGELIAEALEISERRASERGGWSALT